MGRANTCSKKSTTTSKAPNAKHSKAAKKTTRGKNVPKTILKNNMDGSIEDRIKQYLIKLHRIGISSVKGTDLANACGYQSQETKSFRKAKQDLKQSQEISVQGDNVSLSETFLAQLPADPNPCTTNQDFHHRVKEVVNDKYVSKLIDVFTESTSMTILDAAKAMGFQSVETKTFRNAKNVLKDLGFLEGTKILTRTDKMFPFGTPMSVQNV